MADGKISRGVVKGSTLSIGVVLVVVLTVFVNYFGWKYYQRFDWTSGDLYSLSEKSENILSELDRDIAVTVMLGPQSDAFSEARELLERYESRSPRIEVRVIDPEKNLAEAQRLVDEFELSRLDVVVFEAGDDRRVIEASELVDYDYSAMQYGGSPEVTGFKGEQLFTGAILELMESRKPRILFTTGHGEAAVDDFSPRGLSDLADMLGRDNFEIESWASLGADRVPEGTDLVVVVGPRSSFVEPEVEALRAYLDAGGRLLLLVDPTLSEFGGLEPLGLEGLLADYGIELGENIIVDPANPLPFFGPDTIFVSSYRDHDVTRSLRQADLQVILPLARSVGRAEEIDGLTIAELFTTSEEGWGETDLENLRAVEKQEADLEGPVPLAVAVEGKATAAEDEPATASPEESEPQEGEPVEGEPAEGETDADGADGESEAVDEASPPTRLLVIGDSDFVSNNQIRSASNGVLANNALNWLVERQALVGIPPKTPQQTKLTLTESELSTITWLVLLILPGLAVAAGVAVYLRRRR